MDKRQALCILLVLAVCAWALAQTACDTVQRRIVMERSNQYGR